MSWQELERLLRSPAPEPVQSPPPQQMDEVKPETEPEATKAPSQDATSMGESIQAKKRDPLGMINRATPLLSAEKHETAPRPLSRLVAAASADESCVWNRVRPAYSPHSESLRTVPPEQ